MSNIVSLKIQIEGSDSIKTVSFSADELAAALNKVRESSDRLSGSIVNWAQAGQAAELLGSIVGDLTSVFQDLSEAYAEQEAAETRLAQAMRNTMDATEEDIDAIKRLCSAQQDLGIIGDEVQLSGAQELATYLEKKSSLERLIPVMNDMLAQQYEYNATSESAAQIASMLGKVMNGQTEALSRYGYKFDEAQKKVLQFGTEEERAAVLAEVVEQSVGGMNAALARTPTGLMKQAANAIGDLKEQFGALATRMTPVLQTFASLTTTVTGIGKLISSVKSLTAALKAAQISAKALKVAMAGIAGIALAAIITSVALLGKKTREAQETAEKANEEYREMQDRLASARSEIEIDIQKLSSFNGSIAQEKQLVGEMNSKWGETFGTFNTVKEWYKTLSDNVDAYCAHLANQIRLEKIANDIANAKNTKKALRQELNQTDKTVSYDVYSSAGAGGISVKTHTVTEDNSKYKELEGEIDNLDAKIKGWEGEMQDILKEMANSPTFGGKGPGGGGDSGGVEDLDKDIDGYRKSVMDAVLVNKIFNDGQNATEVRLKAMESGITSLIRKYGAESEEIKALIGEYQKLSALRGGVTNLPVAAIQGNGKAPMPSAKELIKEPSFNWSSIEDAPDNLISIQDAAAGASTAIGALSETMSGLSGVIGDGAAGWLTWGANLLKAIGAALPQLAALFAGETAVAGAGALASLSSIPFVGPALAVAALASIVAAAASLPKFAEGALAYGPTIGLFGEYPGAASNPEVVAPLNKLQDLIEPASATFGEVVFEIKGRNLVGVAKKLNRLDSRNNG